jgi:putative transposase
LTLSEYARTELESFARSRALPAGLVRRAKMILLSVDGVSNTAIAERFATSVSLVSLWRRRYREQGLAGLYGEVRPGRPRTHDDDRIAALVRKTLRTRPPDATQWTVRDLAQTTQISKSSVHRYLTLFGVQPHRRRGFKLSTDPFFIEKLRDVVGLYLHPPEQALVLCVDEKSQVQALERTQPGLPLGLGYVQGITHDYYRHGTTTLFAALDVASGTVLSQCKPRHRHQEFSGVPALPRCAAPARSRRAPDRGQLRDPQTRPGAPLVGPASALPPPLHADLRLVAQPDRALVCAHHAARHSPGVVHQRAAARRQDRPVRAALQSPRPPLPLDRHRGGHPREARATLYCY